MDIEYSSRGFLITFFRQGRAFGAISLVILLAGLAYLAITKPVYESKGSLVVKFGRNAQADGAAGDGGDESTRQEIIRSYIKIIASRDFLKERIQAFGLYRLYPELRGKSAAGATPEDLAIRNLLDNDLKISNDQSRIIDISVRNHNPAVAAEFASQVMRAFIDKGTEIYDLPPARLLQKQADEARRQLERARRNYQEFKEKTGISDPEQESAQLLREKSDLSALAFSAVTQAQSKLSDLEAQEAKMETTYRPESTMLAGLRSTIRAARADLRQRVADLNTGKWKKDSSLSSTVSAIDARLAYLQSHKGAYDDLLQQVKMRNDMYLNLQKQSEAARIANLMGGKNGAHMSVVDSPAFPSTPARPQKKIFLAITLLAALMSGFGTVLSRELLDDRLSNPEQVLTHIGVPVLAVYRNEILRDTK